MSQIIAERIIKVLIEEGFVFLRQTGSHRVYESPIDRSTVTVPVHGKKNPIHIGVFMEIIKQSKIPKKRFFKN